MDKYYKYFLEQANKILNKSVLICNGVKVQICEIEFYFSDAIHLDPFNHKDEHQLTNGYWYFHRKNGGKYSGGNYKGLDITFGDFEKKIYAGILIRSISVDGKVIEGPCKIVNWILETCKVNSIDELVSQFDSVPGKISENILSLKGCENRGKNIVSAPRFGLSLNKVKDENDVRLNYIFKNYRFTTINLKKGENIISLSSGDYSNKKWYESYQAGKLKDISHFLENPNLKTVSLQCEAYGFFENF